MLSLRAVVLLVGARWEVDGWEQEGQKRGRKEGRVLCSQKNVTKGCVINTVIHATFTTVFD